MKGFATLAVFSIVAVLTLSCQDEKKEEKKCNKSKCKTCTSLVQTSNRLVS